MKPSIMVVLVTALVAASVIVVAKSQKMNNVLYFVVDDFRPEVMAAYGQSQMITPNLDSLANSSLTFAHAYCQQAVCGPSRASFMTGRRPKHTNVFDNKQNFRESGVDATNAPGSDWVTMPEYFKNKGFLTLGLGKTFHPNHPKNWDEPTSWSQDKEYYPFSYYINNNASYAGQPCPGKGPPKEDETAGLKVGVGTPSKIDTWCAVDEPDDHFYDFGLANATIERLQYAAGQQKPFFIQAGFARPHAPWR